MARASGISWCFGKARRDGYEPALKLEYDNRDEAKAAFEANKANSRHRSGAFLEWHKAARDWDLIERYPS